jgi:ATP-dependent Clp protease ATP-binding subunit ClpB
VELDLAAIVAGTQWRGMFEERIKAVINRAEASKGKIIFVIVRGPRQVRTVRRACHSS